ncbi:helix-turn-helix domain-containing protein [Streptomyces sp. NPDC059679]|uniref:helix-turn-helix domain-containing protein n=1 Tax=Streptomyces sp. NPDC059679 TaxID=3346903 RepID=UPI00369C812A
MGAAMTGSQAAGSVGMSQPKISKLENGRLLPSVEDVRTLLTLYRAEAAQRDDLLDLTARLHTTVESNRTILHRGAARQQMQIAQVEAEAVSLRYFSPIAVPGLLQTAEYARRVFALDLSGTELTSAVAARQQRQQALYKTEKKFTFVLTEAVLRWGFCPEEVMAAQIGHLTSIATLTNVKIGLIPFASRPKDLPLHGYQIFDDRLATISLEHATVSVTEPRDIATYLTLFSTMSEAAEFGEAARARIAAIGREYQS